MKLFKKITALALAAICFSLPIYADTTEINISTWKRRNSGSTGSIGHAPMHLPITTTFDDATGVITVSAPEDLEGCVYVYNLSGGLEASSPTLNCSLTIRPTSDVHIISLQGETWIGEAKIMF